MNLIDNLPRNSAFGDAFSDDDDVAEAILARGIDGQVAKVRISEWSPEREALADVADLLREVISAITAAAGQKPPRMPRALRPVTALNRVEQRNENQRHQDLVRRMLPHLYPQPPE